jgi:hypothetical protein
MKLFVLTGILLLSLPGAAQAVAPAKGTVLRSPSPDEQAILAFFNEVGVFAQQVLAEPSDTVAITRLLHGPEAARLKQRSQQLTPTIARWRRTFSDAKQEEAAFSDILQRSELKALLALDTNVAVSARLKRNPDLKAALEGTLYDILMQ